MFEVVKCKNMHLERPRKAQMARLAFIVNYRERHHQLICRDKKINLKFQMEFKRFFFGVWNLGSGH